MNAIRFRSLCVAVTSALTVGVVIWALDRPDRNDNAGSALQSAVPVASTPPMAVDEGLTAVDEDRASVEAVDWLRRYRDSTDYATLAQSLADAALSGDSRAPYVLSRVLLECQIHALALKPYSGATLQERAQAYLVDSSSASAAYRAEFMRRASRCVGLSEGNALAGRGLPEEAQQFQYWRDLAVEAGDPVALMERAIRTSMRYSSSDDAEEAGEHRARMFEDLRVAVASGEPQALLAIGGLLVQPSLTEDPQVGFAWWVAACQTGYDCTNANPEVGHGCVEAGTCEAGMTILDTLQRDLGAARYAGIYANGMDILYKVRAQDWDGLQQYLKVK